MAYEALLTDSLHGLRGSVKQRLAHQEDIRSAPDYLLKGDWHLWFPYLALGLRD